MAVESPAASPAPPSLAELFFTFAKVGLISLGGGITGWMMLELVERKRWVDESEFLGGLAISQALPGVNVVNLSLWFGYRMRGSPGALAGVLGMLVPTTTLAVALLGVFELVIGNPTVRLLLAGAIVAAIGLTLAMGLRAVQAIGLRPLPLAICAATVIALSVLRLPLLWVAGIGAPLSIALAYWMLKRGKIF